MSIYSEQRAKSLQLRIREMLRELPDVCFDFINAIDSTTQPLTRYAYVSDLKLFFSFLTASVPAALLLARKMILEEAGRSAPKSGSVRIPMGPFFLAGWLITVSMLNGGSLWQIIPQGGR